MNKWGYLRLEEQGFRKDFERQNEQWSIKRVFSIDIRIVIETTRKTPSFHLDYCFFT